MADFLAIAYPTLALGALACWALLEAQSRVVERWGGRLGAYLISKGRQLRKESVALRLERQMFSPKRSKGLAGVVVAPDAPDASQKACSGNPISSVHCVVPFRRVRP